MSNQLLSFCLQSAVICIVLDYVSMKLNALMLIKNGCLTKEKIKEIKSTSENKRRRFITLVLCLIPVINIAFVLLELIQTVILYLKSNNQLENVPVIIKLENDFVDIENESKEK